VPPALPPSQLPAPAHTVDSFCALIRRAEAGDETSLPDLRRLLEDPRAVAAFGDLAGRVRAALLKLVAGTNLLRQELTAREMDRLRADLLGPAPTVVERLLAERVVVGWLQLQEADLRLAAARADRGSDVLQRRADHAHRRFLAALRALATVRRLAVPALQVNIGERQVNVAG
jgi:hypothetical protein